MSIFRDEYHRHAEFVTDRPGHDRRYASSTTKIRKELGWEPATSFGVGLEATARWYIQNRDWISNVTAGDYRKYYDSVYAQAWRSVS